DYVTKPFSPRELLARIRVALRRSAPPEPDPLKPILERARVTLTQTESKFLSALARQPGQLVPQKKLLEEIWGPNHLQDTHYLRILVSRLRKKLGPLNVGIGIATEPGLGYRLLLDESS